MYIPRTTKRWRPFAWQNILSIFEHLRSWLRNEWVNWQKDFFLSRCIRSDRRAFVRYFVLWSPRHWKFLVGNHTDRCSHAIEFQRHCFNWRLICSGWRLPNNNNIYGRTRTRFPSFCWFVGAIELQNSFAFNQVAVRNGKKPSSIVEWTQLHGLGDDHFPLIGGNCIAWAKSILLHVNGQEK